MRKTAFVLTLWISLLIVVAMPRAVDAAESVQATESQPVIRAQQVTHEETYSATLSNSRSLTNTSNGGVVISAYNEPDGYNVASMRLELLTATAKEQWLGGWHVSAGASAVLTPAGAVIRRAQSFDAGFPIRVQNVSLFSARTELGGSDQEFQIALANNTVDGKPSNAWCINNTVELHTMSTTSRWNNFSFPCPLNYTQKWWVLVNATKLGTDQYKTFSKSTNPQPVGEAASYQSGSWTLLTTQDLIWMANVTRINAADNSTYATSNPHALNLSVSEDGGTPALFGASGELDLTSDDVTLSLQSNLSADVDLKVTWTLVEEGAGEPPSEAEEPAVSSRYPDHLDVSRWCEEPWEYDLIEDTGWHVFFLSIYGIFLVVFLLTRFRIGLLITLGALTVTVIVWFALWQVALAGGVDVMSGSASWLNDVLSPLIWTREWFTGLFGG